MTNFKRNLAVVIGINQYHNGINPLGTAVADAVKVSEILTDVHDYTLIHPNVETAAVTLNDAATLQQLRRLFGDVLPNIVKPTDQDRLLIYFAGHGITRQVDDKGPQGFLVPQDADINNPNSLLPMSELYDLLNQLECRHLLVILDCCFAGMFRWASTRKVVLVPDEIHWEHYHRFIKYPAWQVITSASHNQEALDYLDNRVADDDAKHSPFAEALFEGLLAQKADIVPDGVITTAELYLYLRDYVEKNSNEQQTPGFWPLGKHDRGEYIFQIVPDEQLQLKSAPQLEKDNNPYRGLESFEEKHSQLFFGREEVIDDLLAHISDPSRQFTVVEGISGSGKSSLVKAGLVSALRENHADKWHLFTPIRPGSDPYLALATTLLPPETELDDLQQASEAMRTSPEVVEMLVTEWINHQPHKRFLLVIDQFEELITLAPQLPNAEPKGRWAKLKWKKQQNHLASDHNIPQWQTFTEALAQAVRACPQLHILVTLRSDFCPRFQSSTLSERWADARFLVRPMRSDELRAAVIGPANEMALYFEPANLVDRLVDEVAQTPGALPLLSFTLSELYLKLYTAWHKDGKEDRALSIDEQFYQQGGVAGLLAKRANEEYDQLPDEAHRRTMRRVILRMVELEGSETVKRRVPKQELMYVDAEENRRVEHVLCQLNQARLIVNGYEAGKAYVEPAHDFLVRGWDRLQAWIQSEQETLLLQRLLIPAANNWQQTKRDLWNGNSRLVLLKQIQKSRNNWLNQLEILFVRSSVNRRRMNMLLRLGLVALALSAGSVIWLSSERLVAATQKKLNDISENLQQKRDELEEAIAQTAAIQAQREVALQDLDTANALTNEAERQAKTQEKKALEASKLAHENYIDAQRNAMNQLSETAQFFMSTYKSTEAMLYAITAAKMSQAGTTLWTQRDVPSTIPVNLLTTIEHSRELNLFTISDNADESALSPVPLTVISDEGMLLSSDYDGYLHRWDSQSRSGDPVSSVDAGGEILNLSLMTDNSALVGVKEEKTFALKRLSSIASRTDPTLTLETVKQFETEEALPELMAIAPIAQTIAIATVANAVQLLDNQGNLFETITPEEITSIQAIAISPEGETIAIAGRQASGSQIQIWQAGSSLETVLLATIPLPTAYRVSSVSITPDGQRIVSADLLSEATKKSQVRVWNLDGSLHAHQLMEIAGSVNTLVIASDGTILATATAPKRNSYERSLVNLWSIDGTPLLEQGIEGAVVSSAITANGEQIALTSIEDHTAKIHLWEGTERQDLASAYRLQPISKQEEKEATAVKSLEQNLAADVPADNPVRSAANHSATLVGFIAQAEQPDTEEQPTIPLSNENTTEVDSPLSEREDSETDESKRIEENSANETLTDEPLADESSDDTDSFEQEGSSSSSESENKTPDEVSNPSTEDGFIEKSTIDDASVNEADINEADINNAKGEKKETTEDIKPERERNKGFDLQDLGLYATLRQYQTLVDMTPDGRTKVSAETEQKSATANETVTHRMKIWRSDESTDRVVLDKLIKAPIVSISVSDSGKRVALLLKADKKNTYYVKVWDEEAGEEGAFLSNPIVLKAEQDTLIDAAVLAQISPDGNQLASAIATEGKTKLQVWKMSHSESDTAATEPRLASLEKDIEGEVSVISFARDGQTLVSASNQAFHTIDGLSYRFGGRGVLNLWDISKAEMELRKEIKTKGYVAAIALSSKTLSEAADNDQEAADDQEIAAITYHKSQKGPTAIQADSASSESVSIRSKVELFTWQGRRTSKLLEIDQETLATFVSLMPDGENIVMGGHSNITSSRFIEGQRSLNSTIDIINKRSRQSYSLTWPNRSNHNSLLSSFAMSSEGSQLLTGLVQKDEMALVSWDLSINRLLQAGCDQIKHHPILHNPSLLTTSTPDISAEAKNICQQLLQP